MGEQARPNMTKNEIESIPLLDQHVALVKNNPSIWAIPIGVLAVTLRFIDPIAEYTDLVLGLISNIKSSMISKFTN